MLGVALASTITSRLSVTLWLVTWLRRETTQMTTHTAASSTSRTTGPTAPLSASSAARPPMIAAPGRVSSQATTSLRAMPQRTSPPSRPTPDPRIAPVATWVVERPKPRWEDARIVAVVAAPEVAPCGVSMSTMPLPRVRMMRQPPE